MSPVEQRVRRLEHQNRFLIAGVVLLILCVSLVAVSWKQSHRDSKAIQEQQASFEASWAQIDRTIKSTRDQQASGLKEQDEKIAKFDLWLNLLQSRLTSVEAGLEAATPGKDTVFDVVKARAFHVVGENGTVLVRLEDTYGFGYGVAGTVTTVNARGQDLVQLGTTEDGNGAVVIKNGRGHALVELGVRTDGPGFVATSDPRLREERRVLTTGP